MSNNMYEIKKFLGDIFDSGVDGVTFLPVNPDLDLNIGGFNYKRKYKEITSELGNFYHILLYKVSDTGHIINPDNFTAVLTDPKVYVMNLIRSNFYGIVVKQTKGSKKFVNELYQKMTEST